MCITNAEMRLNLPKNLDFAQIRSRKHYIIVILYLPMVLKKTDNTLRIVRPVFIVVSDAFTPAAGAQYL